MKTKIFLAAMAVLAPLTAHAQCTITPGSFVLQENKTQVFTVPANTCATPITWSCSPSGSCGSFTGTTTKTTYTAPGSVKTVTITATPHTGTAGTASVQVNAVQINALGISNGGTAATDFSNLILGSSNTQVSGYMAMLPWSTADPGNAQNNGTACYPGAGMCPGLDSFDSTVSALFPNGVITKKINIVVTPITGGGAIGGTTANTDTPQWVLNEITSYPGCGYNIGGPGFPDVTGLVNTNFMTQYKRFINIVLNHYATLTSSPLSNYIGYIRFGLSAGGEVYPFCDPSQYNDTAWITYVEGMMDYISTTEAGITGQTHPAIQIMTAVNSLLSPPNPPDNTLPEAEAPHADNMDSMGFGSEGLQKADLSSPPTSCTSDWCALFGASYTNTEPFELQTTLQSDPIDANQQTGSLCRLVPFATFNKANILELYGWDLLYTYDSAKFCTLNGTPGDRNYNSGDFCNAQNQARFTSEYQTVITNAVTGVAGSDNPPLCTQF